MKNITDIITESDIDQESKIKNQVCIDLIKIIDNKNVDKLSSNDNGSVWKIQLKGTNSINLMKLAKEIVKIDGDSKYDCVQNILLEYDTKTIIVK